jgi:hypothetical protein
MTPRAAVSVAVVALIVGMSHPTAAGEVPKLTVRFTPLVRVTPGEARGVVTVPRHLDNRVLRVILESDDYYSLSAVQLDGEDAPLSHSFSWRDLPPGSYRVTVQVYGTGGLRDSTSIGSTASISQER